MIIMEIKMSNHFARTQIFANVIKRHLQKPIHRMLVVGCGSGVEAAALRDALGCQVVGIDLYAKFDDEAQEKVRLVKADATDLPFNSGVFDFVFSYHALEHIPDFKKALSEMNRVLSKDGQFCIGTPNRARALGYIGCSTSLKNKIKWNINDWKARLTGKFRNELGAHAGFTARELGIHLRNSFGAAKNISHDYYQSIYSNKKNILKIMKATGLSSIAYPSVYFAGTKHAEQVLYADLA